MRILGIDPGLNATGYGIIDVDGGTIEIVTAGAVRPPAKHPLAHRLKQLHDGLSQIIHAHRPDLVVIEALFVHHQFLTTAVLMAHARGVACLVSAQLDRPLVEYLPTRVKKALTGYGTASKDQVARAVSLWTGRHEPSWTSDTTDALALAIAHAHIASVPAVCQQPRHGKAKCSELAAINS